MSVANRPMCIVPEYSHLRRLRAHCDRQTLCASVHLSDMVAQVPRVVVHHFGIFSVAVTTENLASADVENAFGRPLVLVSLVSARHVEDSLSWTELASRDK